jgi:hypothetical protein
MQSQFLVDGTSQPLADNNVTMQLVSSLFDTSHRWDHSRIRAQKMKLGHQTQPICVRLARFPISEKKCVEIENDRLRSISKKYNVDQM